MLLGGAELPALWVVVFLAALAEAALHFMSWSRLEDELEDQTARSRYSRYVAHVRTFNVLCVLSRIVAATLLVTLIVRTVWRGGGRLAASLGAAAALLAGAEIAGRAIGRKWSAGVLEVCLPLLYWVSYPVRLLWGGPGRGQEDEEEPEPEVVEAAKEEIRVAIEDGATEGALEVEQKQMIEGILKFPQGEVSQIMTPRTEIESLDADAPLAEAARALEGFRHSRIPVYEGTLDRVVGIVYVKDLLSASRREGSDALTLRDVMREPSLCPETRTLGSLLQHFQDEHVQIAVVVDEYGGVSGVVTVEDIMEEIVGEIQDEYDQEDHENRVRVRSSGGIVAHGRVRIDELNERFGLDIPEDEGYDTVGGYVTWRLGRVPEAGQEFRAGDLLVRVLDSDPRRVYRVLLEPGGADQTG